MMHGQRNIKFAMITITISVGSSVAKLYAILTYFRLAPIFCLKLKRQLRTLLGFHNKTARKLGLLNVKLHNLTVALLTYAVNEHLHHQQTFLSPVALDKK